MRRDLIKVKYWARPGIDPGISRSQGENLTTRPTYQLLSSKRNKDIYAVFTLLQPITADVVMQCLPSNVQEKYIVNEIRRSAKAPVSV